MSANLSMLAMVQSGEAIDLSNNRREGKYYVIDKFIDGVDYCVLNTEQWIWSIGRRKKDGVILACTKSTFYQNSEYECIWLR